MQAVILAAGKSTRTYPLTIAKPKPLLKVANKTLLEHNLDSISGIADEALLVVGYKKNLIKGCIGNRYKNIKISYIEQKQQLGTGNALLAAEDNIKNEFILLHADDIYSREDFKNVLKHKYSILTAKVKNPEAFGVIIKKNGMLAELIEKPQKFISNLVNTGLYKLDKKIFHLIKKLKKSKRGEYELTDAIMALSKNENVNCVTSKQWLPVSYPWDLLKADKILRKNKVIIGKNSKIFGNVKNSSIGDNCIIKGSVSDSIIMDNVIIEEFSVVECSVIAENVYFNGRAAAGKNVYSEVKGKKIKVEKLGSIIADNVKAKNALVEPGCKIWPNKKIYNMIIKEDVI